jgi:capsular polysaccharide biosynthesis protein
VSEVRRRDGVDLDAEREVDLRSAWTRISERWYLPLAGLVVGAILGVLVSVGSGDVYRAEALIYLGQPFTSAGGGQLQSLQTNPKTVSEIVRSEAAIKRAATAASMRPGGLRGNVTATPVVQAGQVARNFTPLVEIEARAPTRVKAERAANSLANSVVTQVVGYPAAKIKLLEAQIADDERQLDDIARRIETANEQQRLALADDSLSLTEKLLVSTNSNATVNSAEQRRGSVLADLNVARGLLAQAKNVELSRVVQPAVAVRTSATSRRNAAAVGALAGLLLGALAAIVADPWLRRRSSAATA